MHQIAFGGSLSAPPDPLAAIWGLLLRGGEGGRKEKGREEIGGDGREGGVGEERVKAPPFYGF